MVYKDGLKGRANDLMNIPHHAWNQAATFHPRYGKFNLRNFDFDGKNRFEYFMSTKTC